MSGARVAVFAVFALTAMPVLTSAQARVTGADLVGSVIDESGGVMPGVVATVVNADTGVHARSRPTTGESFARSPFRPDPTKSRSLTLDLPRKHETSSH